MARDRHGAVRDMVDNYVREGKVANAIAAIGRGAWAPEFVGAGTLAFDRTSPVSADSLFRLHSMSKPITGVAAMCLVETGRIDLDQPLADIFPAFGRMTVLLDPGRGLDARPAVRPILMRHLLTHTAGLGYSILGEGPLERLYVERGIYPLQRSLADDAGYHRPPGLIAFADAVATLPLVAEPGTQWRYSIGLDVMAAVIERVSGVPFDRFLAENIFAPLGMRDTGFVVPPGKLDRLTTNYTITPDGPVVLDAPPATIYAQKAAFPFGGSGLVSSPRDYDRFLTMLLNGGRLGHARVIAPRTAGLAMSNLLPDGLRLPAPFNRTGPSGFGAGGRVLLQGQSGGESAGTFGWSGSAGTTAWVDPARGLRACGFSQFMPVTAYPFLEEFSDAVYKDLK